MASAARRKLAVAATSREFRLVNGRRGRSLVWPEVVGTEEAGGGGEAMVGAEGLEPPTLRM